MKTQLLGSLAALLLLTGTASAALSPRADAIGTKRSESKSSCGKVQCEELEPKTLIRESMTPRELPALLPVAPSDVALA